MHVDEKVYLILEIEVPASATDDEVTDGMTVLVKAINSLNEFLGKGARISTVRIADRVTTVHSHETN